MKTIEKRPLEAVAPGMILAEPATDQNGRVLVPAGAMLTESSIAGLARREIGEVVVEMEVAETPADAEAHRGRVVERLDRLFRHAGKDSETMALYQAILEYRMENRA